MKKFIPLIFFGTILFLLMGCPYDSQIPLSDSKNSNIDTLLIGEWVGGSIRDSGDIVNLNVIKFNDNEYFIEFKATDLKGSVDIQKWRTYITPVGTEKIMNITFLGEKEEEYLFFKYKTDGSILSAWCASDNFIKNKFTSQKDFFNFFLKNIDKKELFEDELVFKKKK